MSRLRQRLRLRLHAAEGRRRLAAAALGDPGGVTKRNDMVGITVPVGPFGVSVCVRRWAIGGAIGLRKRMR